MRAKAGILVMLGLLLIICVAGAAEPYTMTLTSSKADWELVANGEDEATISALVVNTSTGAVADADVKFSVIVPTYGSMLTSSATTDAAGIARSNFRVNTKSGTAEIFANMTYVDAWGATYYKSATLQQKIDHDSPYVPFYTLNTSSTVKFMEPVKITFYDIWGNRIDSNNTADIHKVTLHIHGPSPDDCGFVVGSTYPHDIAMILDPEGNITPLVSLTSTAGSNNILLDRFGSIPDKMKSITAVSNGIPFYIEQYFDPDAISPSPYPSVVADGHSQFVIQYVLYDQFWNPTSNQPLNLTTDFPEYYPDVMSSTTGQVWYTYGPKSFTHVYTLTATAVNNQSVTISKQVRFYNSTPTNLEVFSNPHMMASRDANADIYSDITAKVTDESGNPIDGQAVTFKLESPVYTPSTVGVTTVPSFSKTSEVTTITATTGTDGLAVVQFYPSAFAVSGEANYERTATGTSTITAEWTNTETGELVQRDTQLTWKNYPYLSAVMTITPAQILAGDTVDVNLKLNGDGWALAQKPIDVALGIDRSGSMSLTDIANAKSAATIFTNCMTANDYEALVLFGGTGSIPTQALTNSKGTLLTKISGITRISGGTPMRTAMYDSANYVKSSARADTVRAVIVMTDGEWNDEGDPLGRYGSNTSASWLGDGVGYGSVVDYIKDNNIRLYIIGLGVTSTYRVKLEDYVQKVGTGKYYHAPSSEYLNNIYTEIAGDLREAASVNTEVTMDFGKIVVNEQLVNTATEGDVFMYVADPGTENNGILELPKAIPAVASGSTYIAKYNATGYGLPDPDFTYSGPVKYNMTGIWNANSPHQLLFSVGNVSTGETWETNFRLRVLKEGSIRLFGPDTQISFTDTYGGTGSLKLENLSSFTSSSTTFNTGMSSEILSITDLRRTDTNPAGDLTSELPITWTTTYTGLRPVTHDVSFIHDTDPPVRFDQKITYGGGTRTMYTELDLSKLPPGGYQIQVHAYTDDGDDIESIGPWSYNVQRRPFIMVE